MFMMLVRKDFRLQLPVLIAAGLLFIAPATIYFTVDALVDQHGRLQGDTQAAVIAMIVAGMAAAALTVPVFAGVAAAKERRERSAEFLEAMPIQRWRIVSSRALVAFLCGLVPAVLGGVLLIAIAALNGENTSELFRLNRPTISPNAIDASMVVFGTLAAAAGVAWFVGSLIRSEVVAAAIGIAIPIAVHGAVGVALSGATPEAMQSLGTYEGSPAPYALAQFVVAIPCLIAGTIIALRRTSP